MMHRMLKNAAGYSPGTCSISLDFSQLLLLGKQITFVLLKKLKKSIKISTKSGNHQVLVKTTHHFSYNPGWCSSLSLYVSQ